MVKIISLFFLFATVCNSQTKETDIEENFLNVCPCEKVELKESFERHSEILAVQLIAKRQNNNRLDKNQMFASGIVNEFKVIDKIKGDFQINDTIQVLTGNGLEDDGYIFQISERYILYHDTYIDKCSPTSKFEINNWQKIKRLAKLEMYQIPMNWSHNSTRLYSFVTDENYFFSGLQAEIINSNKDEILNSLNKRLKKNNDIPINSLIEIFLNDDNKVSNCRVLGTGKPYELELNNEIIKYIERNFKFKTKNKNCLLSNSKWYYSYEK